jgi:hypothetical protein
VPGNARAPIACVVLTPRVAAASTSRTAEHAGAELLLRDAIPETLNVLASSLDNQPLVVRQRATAPGCFADFCAFTHVLLAPPADNLPADAEGLPCQRCVGAARAGFVADAAVRGRSGEQEGDAG